MEIVKIIPKPDGDEDVFYYSRHLSENLTRLNYFWERIRNTGFLKATLENNMALIFSMGMLKKEVFAEIDKYTNGKKLQVIPSGLSELLKSINQNKELYEANDEIFDQNKNNLFIKSLEDQNAEKIKLIKNSIEINHSNPDTGTAELAHLTYSLKNEINKLEKEIEEIDRDDPNSFSVIYFQSQEIKHFICQWLPDEEMEEAKIEDPQRELPDLVTKHFLLYFHKETAGLKKKHIRIVSEALKLEYDSVENAYRKVAKFLYDSVDFKELAHGEKITLEKYNDQLNDPKIRERIKKKLKQS